MSLDDGEYQLRESAFLHGAILPILPFLENPAVTEIMLNADGCVWIDEAGRLGKTAVTIDAPRALAILRAVAGQADLQLTAQSPSLDAELRPWGARVKAAIPPITKAPVFTIRKPPARVFTLDEYVDAGILTAAHAEILRAAVAAKQNILVSGATASGKTTFVNALLAEIARTDDRVFIVEDIPELQCASPNRVQYHVQPPFTTRLAIMDALRSRPDRIVVGEVREGGAALELIKAWNTGHPGGTGTLHANDNRHRRSGGTACDDPRAPCRDLPTRRRLRRAARHDRWTRAIREHCSPGWSCDRRSARRPQERSLLPGDRHLGVLRHPRHFLNNP